MNNGIEIERSWLLNKLPDLSIIDHSVYHEVGYLFNNNGELRVFRKKLPDRWKYAITIKGDGDLSRKEWEIEIEEWAFNVVWPNTEGARVSKTRHFVYYVLDNKIFLLEIDEYFDSLGGLIRLECEFNSEEVANNFVLPSWASDAQEVTLHSGYKNKNLAIKGWPIK